MASFETYAIPAEGKYIVYRPLLRLAFLGNRAMANVALRLAGGGDPGDEHPDAVAFLARIGFLVPSGASPTPDPEPPGAPSDGFAPHQAVLLLTGRCNLRCTYCYADGGVAPGGSLHPSLARAAIDHVAASACRGGRGHFALTFHGGGEPTRAWGCLTASVKHARGQALPARIGMVSNGIWSKQQRDWLLANLDTVSISFDGAQDTQDRQRPFADGRGSWRRAMETLRALDQAGFSYGIRMTAQAPWRDTLARDVAAICENTGCRTLQVEPAFNTARGRHQGPTTEEATSFAEGFMEAFDVASAAGRDLSYSGARPWLLTRAFCTAPYDALIVNPEGDLVSCYEIARRDHPLASLSCLGRVGRGRVSVDDEARAALTDYLRARRDACRGCFSYWHCAGDCYTRRAAAEAEPAPPTPDGQHPLASTRCLMNRQITAQLLLCYISAGDGVWQGQVTGRPTARGAC